MYAQTHALVQRRSHRETTCSFPSFSVLLTSRTEEPKILFSTIKYYLSVSFYFCFYCNTQTTFTHITRDFYTVTAKRKMSSWNLVRPTPPYLTNGSLPKTKVRQPAAVEMSRQQPDQLTAVNRNRLANRKGPPLPNIHPMIHDHRTTRIVVLR